MSQWRFEIVKRNESHTGNQIDCLHVMIDSNSLIQIADTYIPLDDIQTAIKRHKAEQRAKETPVRRSEGAKSGWEIRRAKRERPGAAGKAVSGE